VAGLHKLDRRFSQTPERGGDGMGAVRSARSPNRAVLEETPCVFDTAIDTFAMFRIQI